MSPVKNKSKIALIDCGKNRRLDSASFKRLKKEVQPKILSKLEEASDDAINNRNDIYLLATLPKSEEHYKFFFKLRKLGCNSPIIFLVNEDILELAGVFTPEERAKLAHLFRKNTMRLNAKPSVDSLEIKDINKGGFLQAIERAAEATIFRKVSKEALSFRAVFESLSIMFYIQSWEPALQTFNYEYLSPAFEYLGYDLEEFYSDSMLLDKLMPLADYEMMVEVSEGTEEERLPQTEVTTEYRVIKKDGDIRWWQDHGKGVFDENGNRLKWLGVITDITDRKNIELELKESEKKHRDLIENAHDIIYKTDGVGNIISINQAVEKIIGYTVEEALKLNVKDIVATDKEGWTEEQIRKNYRRRNPKNYVIDIRDKWGNEKSLEISSRIVRENGVVKEVDCIARNVTSRKEYEKKLKYRAHHDSLTGLPNRKHFMKYLTRAINRRKEEESYTFAVLFIDLDRFKIVNDGLGHHIGDKLLTKISETLKTCVRPTDVIARLGGDEFTILAEIKTIDQATSIAERIKEVISVPFQIEGHEVFSSASVGIIISDEIERNEDEFLRDADSAMYYAKGRGKARYEIFDQEMLAQNRSVLELENDLRNALKKNEFIVHYQPIISLVSGEVLEMEALIRWEHPTKGLVHPGDFITIAEETGLIVEIGEWILEEACQQTKIWQQEFPEHKELSISVNLSTKQLMNRNLLPKLKEILDHTKLDSPCLKLEITESAIMENSDTALQAIKDIISTGVSFSCDDFGTGYSSLSYLHKFPFERIKIDRSFIGTIGKIPISEEIIRTILVLGENLSLEVVAEGIETEGQLQKMCSLGCQLGQGYFLAKPSENKDITNLLKSGLQLETPINRILPAEVEIQNKLLT